MLHRLPRLSFSFPEVEDFLRNSLFFAKEHAASVRFNKLLGALGTPPLFTVVRVNTLKTTLHDAQQQLQKILEQEGKDGKRCNYKVTEHYRLSDILLIHGSGPASDLVPVVKEIIVDLHCGAAILRGADIYAPGVMAAHPGIDRGDVVSVYADLDGKCRKGLTKQYDGKKLFVGNGTAVLARKDIFCSQQNMSGVAVCMTSPLFSCPSLSGVLPDLLFLQNLPSAVVGHVLDPQPGEMILDMCAAPGGKTSHIASLMGDKGIVVAFDKSEPKVAKLKANCDKLGVQSVKSFVYDGIKALDPEKQYNRENAVLPPSPPYPCGTFDRILLDAPCSALGQRPQFVVRMTLKELQSYPRLQRKLFTTAVGLLKEGGVLVYSTCTITPQENEEQVAWALRSFPCLRLAKQNPQLGGLGLANCGLSDEECLLVQRFDPTKLYDSAETEQSATYNVDTIGFFIAKFVKSC
ncbi:hypothetical protein ACROYT_G023969 [Oculina patagonica]